MIFTKENLKRTFLGRLRTQERAYDEIGIYYTPRLYAKLCKPFPDLKYKLKLIYDQLIDQIEIPNSNGDLRLSSVRLLELKGDKVEILLENGNKIQLENFKLVKPNIRCISLDHTESFFNLINRSKSELISLVKLTTKIQNGSKKDKEQMRKEYNRIVQEYTYNEIIAILNDVSHIATITKIKLMPSHLNFKKGNKNA